MHRDEQTDSLRDELGLELERLLAVDVAPELRVRVHERIAREQERNRAWWPAWQLVTAGAVAAVVIAAAAIGPIDTTAPQEELAGPAVAPSSVAAARPVAVPPPTAASRPATGACFHGNDCLPRARKMPGAQAPARSGASTSGASTLRTLVAQIRDGRVEPTVLPTARETGIPLKPLTELTIDPVAIEPLAALPLLAGEQR